MNPEDTYAGTTGTPSFDPKAPAEVKDWIILILAIKFAWSSGGKEIVVEGGEIEAAWVDWIEENSGTRPRPSNVSRRFRELREEWRKEEKSLEENGSRLWQELGVGQIDRVSKSPLSLRLVQRLQFDLIEDCPLVVGPEEEPEEVRKRATKLK